MKQRFWLIQRRGIYYLLDSTTGKKQSLRTRDKKQAQAIFKAKQDAQAQPQLNLALARAYLAGHDPRMRERTWQDVMERQCTHGQPVTQERARRAMDSPAFDGIRNRALMETTSEHLLQVMEGQGNAVNHYLRRLHNLALGLGWLAWPILPPKLWPKPSPAPKRAITWEEHSELVQSFQNAEWRLYLEVLWEVGASQSDAASLTDQNLDWKNRTLTYSRMKLAGRPLPPACIQIGQRLEVVLNQLPKGGFLFPRISQMEAKQRAAEFRRKCRLLKLEGISLHSYRYAWAERAKAAGYPERWAQAALGHNSRAVHQAYARNAKVICPSLEDFEKKILPFPEGETQAKHQLPGE